MPSENRSAQNLLDRQIKQWDRIAAALKAGRKASHDIPERPIVTVSGTMGSGREEIAIALCDKLNYELYGRELVDAVAAELKVNRPVLEDLDERVQDEVKLLIASFMRGRQTESAEYLKALAKVMAPLAEAGGAVILGRGAAFVYADQPRLLERVGLSVRIEAPMTPRIERVSAGWNLDTAKAKDLIEKRDEEQGQFIKRHFNRDIRDPMVYDLTINTARVPVDRAVDLILDTLKLRGISIPK